MAGRRGDQLVTGRGAVDPRQVPAAREQDGRLVEDAVAQAEVTVLDLLVEDDVLLGRDAPARWPPRSASRKATPTAADELTPPPCSLPDDDADDPAPQAMPPPQGQCGAAGIVAPVVGLPAGHVVERELDLAREVQAAEPDLARVPDGAKARSTLRSIAIAVTGPSWWSTWAPSGQMR